MLVGTRYECIGEGGGAVLSVNLRGIKICHEFLNNELFEICV